MNCRSHGGYQKLTRHPKKVNFVSESKTYTEAKKKRHIATSFTNSLNAIKIQKKKDQGDWVTQDNL